MSAGNVVESITGVHPYAEYFPLASDEELDELTESIAVVGLIQPLVIIGKISGVNDGRLADGRNRRTACDRAGVEPSIEYRDFADDDELKEFVIGVNTTGRRESMTVQIAAASTALILGEEKRVKGQWDNKRGPGRKGEKNFSPFLESSERKALAQAGLVLDILGRNALVAVTQGGTTLNAAYADAKKVKDEEDELLAEEAREERREAEAKTFIEGKDSELASSVGAKGSRVDTYRDAVALWESRNAAEVAERRKQEADHSAAVKRYADYIRAFLSSVNAAATLADDDLRDEVLEALQPHDRDRFLRIEKEATWPTTI